MCNKKVRKLLRKRSREAQRTFAAGVGQLHGADAPIVLAYAWISRGLDGELAGTVRVNEALDCGVGYETFDWRLLSGRLSVEVRSDNGFLAPAGSGRRCIEFPFDDPDPSDSGGEAHLCGVDSIPFRAAGEGSETVRCEWASQMHRGASVRVNVVVR